MSAWLIYDSMDGAPYYGNTFICLDQTDALESFMAFIEEEIYEIFYDITQDTFEDADQDWEEKAQWVSAWDSMWCVMEVPVIRGDSCR